MPLWNGTSSSGESDASIGPLSCARLPHVVHNEHVRFVLALTACGVLDKHDDPSTDDTGRTPDDTSGTGDTETADADGDGFSSVDGDCDDADAAVNPAAGDVAVDGVDQNCDGLDGPDADGDGHVDAAAGGDDCDDTDATVYAGGDEVWGDGIDQDCDGVADVEGEIGRAHV